MARLADRIRHAFDDRDLVDLGALLAPDATWGDDPAGESFCHDRNDIIRHLKQLFEMFDAEHMLLFSSDFPHWDGDTPDFALRGFSETFKRRVLAGNAIELFGL